MAKVLATALFIFCTPFLVHADEAFVLEGALGTSQSSLYTAEDLEVKPKGSTALLRLHIPLVQNPKHILALTFSNQMVNANVSGPASDQAQFLIYSGYGFGLSYRYRIFVLGAEYQQTSFRQITTGTNSGQVSYITAIPSYYGGLLFRMGHLGLGLISSVKSVNLPADKTGLTADRPFAEASTLLSVTYHFDGARGAFFKSLFTGHSSN
jgi:hypothetical protein